MDDLAVGRFSSHHHHQQQLFQKLWLTICPENNGSHCQQNRPDSGAEWLVFLWGERLMLQFHSTMTERWRTRNKNRREIVHRGFRLHWIYRQGWMINQVKQPTAAGQQHWRCQEKQNIYWLYVNMLFVFFNTECLSPAVLWHRGTSLKTSLVLKSNVILTRFFFLKVLYLMADTGNMGRKRKDSTSFSLYHISHVMLWISQSRHPTVLQTIQQALRFCQRMWTHHFLWLYRDWKAHNNCPCSSSSPQDL